MSDLVRKHLKTNKTYPQFVLLAVVMFARASVAPSFTSGLSLLSRLINGGIPSEIKRNRYCHSGNSYIISHFYIHFPGIYTKYGLLLTQGKM